MAVLVLGFAAVGFWAGPGRFLGRLSSRFPRGPTGSCGPAFGTSAPPAVLGGPAGLVGYCNGCGFARRLRRSALGDRLGFKSGRPRGSPNFRRTFLMRLLVIFRWVDWATGLTPGRPLQISTRRLRSGLTKAANCAAVGRTLPVSRAAWRELGTLICSVSRSSSIFPGALSFAADARTSHSSLRGARKASSAGFKLWQPKLAVLGSRNRSARGIPFSS